MYNNSIYDLMNAILKRREVEFYILYNYYSLSNLKYKSYINQHYAVSRTEQGRQREPSIKTFLSPLSTEF